MSQFQMNLAPDEMLVQVVMQAHHRTGDRLNVSAPDGRVYEVVIPVGVNVGDPINVIVKKKEEGGIAAGAGDGPEQARVPRTKTDPASFSAVAGATGAGVVAGSVLVGGLIVGPVLVGGAVLVGAQRTDKVGTAVRNAGAKVVDGMNYVGDKAREYQVYDKAKAAGAATYTAAKDMNEKYDITGKASVVGAGIIGGLASGWNYFTNATSDETSRSEARRSPDPPVPAPARVLVHNPVPTPTPAPVPAPLPAPSAPAVLAPPEKPVRPVVAELVDEKEEEVPLREMEYEGDKDAQGLPHGYGTMTLSEIGHRWHNTKYTGHWFKGLRHGDGMVIYFESGNKFIGEFRDDLRDGHGSLRNSDNQVIREGRWFNDHES